MTVRRLFYTSSIALAGVLILSAWHAGSYASLADAQSVVQQGDAAVMPPAPWVDNDPADSLYRAARDAFSKSDFKRAATMFGEVVRKYPTSAYVADALYYRAYALYRLGGDDDLHEALKALSTQHARFPKAKTNGDADELAIRIHGTLAKRGDAPSAAKVSAAASDTTRCDRDDDGVREAAMNALLQMDSESAVPIIKRVLQKRDDCSASLRKQAVFMLSQKRSSETESLLIDAARNDPSRDVREAAIFWMGQVRTDKAAAYLEEIATSSPDMEMREKAVFALTQQNSSRGAALLRRLAESSDTPVRVRESTIFQLGQNRSSDNAEFLRGLFAKLGKGEQGEGLRKSVLFSLSQMRGVGNDRWLLSVAQDASQSMEVRKHALFCAGQAGVSGSDLVALYDRVSEPQLKEQLIWVLSEARDRSASDKLVEIATKDRDVEMRKKAIFWLGQKNDPRIRQLLLDIITKP